MGDFWKANIINYKAPLGVGVRFSPFRGLGAGEKITNLHYG